MALTPIENIGLLVVAYCGLPLTACYMFSPIPTVLKIIKGRDAQEFSAVPYIVGVFNDVMWVFYATITMAATGKDLRPNIYINVFGAILFTGYIIPFFLFSKYRTKNIAQYFGCLSLAAVLMAFFTFVAPHLPMDFHFGGDEMPLAPSLCGLVVVTLNIILYGSPLVQLSLVVRTKSVEFMPLGMSLLTFIISCIWSMQGIILADLTVLIPNVMGVLLGAAQLVLYAMYCGNSSKDSPATKNLAEPMLGA